MVTTIRAKNFFHSQGEQNYETTTNVTGVDQVQLTTAKFCVISLKTGQWQNGHWNDWEDINQFALLNVSRPVQLCLQDVCEWTSVSSCTTNCTLCSV